MTRSLKMADKPGEAGKEERMKTVAQLIERDAREQAAIMAWRPGDVRVVGYDAQADMVSLLLPGLAGQDRYRVVEDGDTYIGPHGEGLPGGPIIQHSSCWEWGTRFRLPQAVFEDIRAQVHALIAADPRIMMRVRCPQGDEFRVEAVGLAL